jgi:hypothetical protein
MINSILPFPLPKICLLLWISHNNNNRSYFKLRIFNTSNTLISITTHFLG